MPVLTNAKHEKFAVLVAKGVSLSKAYVSAGYSAKGAGGSASKLQRNAAIAARISELQNELSAGVIELEINSRNARLRSLQKDWDRLRAGLHKLLDERGADMVDIGPSENAGTGCAPVSI